MMIEENTQSLIPEQRTLYSELIHIAAELARGDGFLSTCAEDMNPRLKRADILKTAERQEEHLKDWAWRVRQVANKLSDTTPATATAAEQEPWRDEGGHAWDIRQNVTCVECPHCCFIFAAEHTTQRFEVDQWEGYDCPNCEGCSDAAPGAATSGAREAAAEEICAYFGDPELAMGGHVNANGIAAIISRHFPSAVPVEEQDALVDEVQRRYGSGGRMRRRVASSRT